MPVVAVGILGALLIATAETYADAFITTLGMGIIVASVVVVSGYAGQLSLCQLALAGFGAWTAARSANSFDLGFVPAILIGVAAAVAVGVVVALPAIRTRGVTLAVATLALALVFSALIFQNPSMTGGFEGIVVDSHRIAGVDLDPLAHPQRYAGLLLVALIVVSLLVANLRRGATGRRMIAVRSNERAASALGIGVIGVKLYAFAVGSGIAAIGGILLAFRQPNVQFLTFDVFGSILLVEYAVLGGLGWISGAAAGATAAPGGVGSHLLTNVLPDLDNVAAWLAIASGGGVIHLLRQAPDGMGSIVWRATNRLRRPRRPEREGATVPSDRDAPSAPMGLALELEDVTVRFGGITAVDDVSFVASPGQVVGLIGPNGAGKTTLLDVITGFTRPSSGRVLLGDTDISSWSPEKRARAGIARSWQALELFDELTVRENLLVAEEARTRRRYVRDLLWPRRSVLSPSAVALVDDLGLRSVLDERPRSLPHGVAKLVGIARAIIATPGIVLLDEPAAGLDHNETRELADVIRRIADRHETTVVVIEHDMNLILNTCDRIVVLDFGRKIGDGVPEEIRNDEAVVRAYLGEPIEAPHPAPSRLLRRVPRERAPADPGIGRGLRPSARGARPRHRGPSRRARRSAGFERGRQDDHDPDPGRRAGAAGRDGRVRRAERRGPASPAGPGRPCPDHRRACRAHTAHSCPELPGVPYPTRCRPGALPGAGSTLGPACGPAVRWPAADARPRAGLGPTTLPWYSSTSCPWGWHRSSSTGSSRSYAQRLTAAPVCCSSNSTSTRRWRSRTGST